MSEAKKQKKDDLAFCIMEGFFKPAMDPDLGPALSSWQRAAWTKRWRTYASLWAFSQATIQTNQMANQNSTQLSNLHTGVGGSDTMVPSVQRGMVAQLVFCEKYC
jgi:hypothetical protein